MRGEGEVNHRRGKADLTDDQAKRFSRQGVARFRAGRPHRAHVCASGRGGTNVPPPLAPFPSAMDTRTGRIFRPYFAMSALCTIICLYHLWQDPYWKSRSFLDRIKLSRIGTAVRICASGSFLLP